MHRSPGVLFANGLTPYNQPAHSAELDRLARLLQVVLLLERHPSFGTGIKALASRSAHCGTHAGPAIEQLGSALRVTPSALAASVTDNLSGSSKARESLRLDGRDRA